MIKNLRQTWIHLCLPAALLALSPALNAAESLPDDAVDICIVNDNDEPLKLSEQKVAAPFNRRFRRNSKDWGSAEPMKVPYGSRQWILAPRGVAVIPLKNAHSPVYVLDLSTLDGGMKVKCAISTYDRKPMLFDANDLASLETAEADGKFRFSWNRPHLAETLVLPVASPDLEGRSDVIQQWVKAYGPILDQGEASTPEDHGVLCLIPPAEPETVPALRRESARSAAWEQRAVHGWKHGWRPTLGNVGEDVEGFPDTGKNLGARPVPKAMLSLKARMVADAWSGSTDLAQGNLRALVEARESARQANLMAAERRAAQSRRSEARRARLEKQECIRRLQAESSQATDPSSSAAPAQEAAQTINADVLAMYGM